MTEMQNKLLRQMATATTHALYLSMIPLQIMRTIWPIASDAPPPKGRAGAPDDPRPERVKIIAR